MRGDRQSKKGNTRGRIMQEYGISRISNRNFPSPRSDEIVWMRIVLRLTAFSDRGTVASGAPSTQNMIQ